MSQEPGGWLGPFIAAPVLLSPLPVSQRCLLLCPEGSRIMARTCVCMSSSEDTSPAWTPGILMVPAQTGASPLLSKGGHSWHKQVFQAQGQVLKGYVGSASPTQPPGHSLPPLLKLCLLCIIIVFCHLYTPLIIHPATFPFLF